MNKFVFKIGLLNVLLWLTSCAQDDLIPANKTTMRLYSEGFKAATSSLDDKAVLLFWELEKFSNIEQNRPFLVAQPTNAINAYNTTPYDTHTLYPPKDNIVAAVGYGPQDLISSQTAGTNDYITLSLPSSKNGATTDLFTAVEPIYGSTSNPFDKAGRTPLRFMHAQSKITFKALRQADMNLGIRNIRISFGKEVISGSLIWNQKQERYITQAGEKEYTLAQEDTQTPLGQTEPTVIGSLFVCAGLTEIPVTVTVEKSDDDFKKNIQTTMFTKTLPFEITRTAEEIGKEANRLYAGEAYTFTLRFDKSTLVLIGKKEPWVDGEKITIPIYPTPNTP